MTLDLAVQGSKGIPNILPIAYKNCKIVSAKYLDQKTWRDLDTNKKGTFDILSTRSWPYRDLTVGGLIMYYCKVVLIQQYKACWVDNQK